jgi:hypothetical protein
VWKEAPVKVAWMMGGEAEGGKGEEWVRGVVPRVRVREVEGGV